MGIFQNLFNSKNSVMQIDMADTALDDTTSGIVSSDTSSTTSVDEEKAMSIASLYQGINIIADTIASMPVVLYRDINGFQQSFPLDARSKMLSGMANSTLTSFNLKKVLVKDLILHGNGYAKIFREGEKFSLEYLPVDVVTAKKDTNGYYFEVQAYSTSVLGERFEAEVVDNYDMLALIRNPKYNSVVGTGLLDYAGEVLDTASRETTYMQNLLKNGLSAKAVLTSKTPIKRELKEKLKSDLKSLYSGNTNAGKILVLEGDIGIVPLSLTPADIKLIDSQHFSISQIARFLNIPKHMLALDKQQGTYSNLTQEKLQLLTNTLMPFVVAMEEAFNQKLLSEEEQNSGYYFQFNTTELLKLTPEEQSTYLLNLYNSKVITLEEVRTALNLGGDEAIISELKAMNAGTTNTGLEDNSASGGSSSLIGNATSTSAEDSGDINLKEAKSNKL